MPMYVFACKQCGEKIPVVRKVDDRNDPLNFDDGDACPGCGGTDPDNFERIQCHSTSMVRGPGWRGAKGHW